MEMQRVNDELKRPGRPRDPLHHEPVSNLECIQHTLGNNAYARCSSCATKRRT